MGDGVDGARDFRQHRANGQSCSGILPIQRTDDFQARFAVQPARARVALFRPGRFQEPPQASDNYSGSDDAAAGYGGITAGVVPRQLSGGRGLGRRQAQAFKDRIVQRGSHLTDFLVGARGIHAVCEQHDE